MCARAHKYVCDCTNLENSASLHLKPLGAGGQSPAPIVRPHVATFEGGRSGDPSRALRRVRLGSPVASSGGDAWESRSPSMRFSVASEQQSQGSARLLFRYPTHRGRACAHIARRLAPLTGTGWQLRPVSRRDGRVHGVLMRVENPVVWGAADAGDVCGWHPQTCCRGLFWLTFLTIFMLCTVSRGFYCVPLVQ